MSGTPMDTRALPLAVALGLASCTRAEPAGQLSNDASPTTIEAGCAGGKPDQGGVTYRAMRQAEALVLEVHDQPWMDKPAEVSRYRLSPDEWAELARIVRESGVRDWQPTYEGHADCQTCRVDVDDASASFCGSLHGEDRGARLRGRLADLAEEKKKSGASPEAAEAKVIDRARDEG